MSSWQCMRCRTTYAVGLASCPQCGDGGYSEGGVVAKVNAAGIATQYVAEGDPVPTDLPPEVQLVGPGSSEAVAEAAAEPVLVGESGPELTEVPAGTEVVAAPPDPSTPPGNSGGSSEPADDEDGPVSWDDYPIRVLRDVAREQGLSPTGAKADLVARLTAYDAEHPAAP